MSREQLDDNIDRDGDDRGRGRGGRGGSGGQRKKRISPEIEATIDYKNPQVLRQFVTDRGKLIPSRVSGATARQQRRIALAVRRARMLALLPFTVTGD